MQGPAATDDEPLTEAFVFQTAEPITHGNARLGCVPVYIGLGPGLRETKIALEMSNGLFIAIAASLKTDVNEDAMTAPKSIMKLLDE